MSTEKSIRKLVRMTAGPLPLTGLVLGEDRAMSGAELWKVAVYGYSLKPEYWAKADCVELEKCPAHIDIPAWLRLVKQHSKDPLFTAIDEWLESAKHTPKCRIAKTTSALLNAASIPSLTIQPLKRNW